MEATCWIVWDYVNGEEDIGSSAASSSPYHTGGWVR